MAQRAVALSYAEISMARPPEASSEATMERILSAAERLLRDERALSLRTLATEAGVSVGAVRYYFPTIQHVLETLIEPLLDAAVQIAHRGGDLESRQTELIQLLSEKRFLGCVMHRSTAMSFHRAPARRTRLAEALTNVSHEITKNTNLDSDDAFLGVVCAGIATTRLALMSEATIEQLSGSGDSDELPRLYSDLVAVCLDPPQVEIGRVVPPPTPERDPLIDAAMKMLNDGETLSLRGLSRRTGRSVGAIRHYYPNLDALVAAVIQVRDTELTALLDTRLRQFNADHWRSTTATGVCELIAALRERRNVSALRHARTYDADMDVLAAHRASPQVSFEARVGHRLSELTGASPPAIRLRTHAIGLCASHIALLELPSRAAEYLGRFAVGLFERATLSY